jgi:hypothetical protein
MKASLCVYLVAAGETDLWLPLDKNTYALAFNLSYARQVSWLSIILRRAFPALSLRASS